MEHKTDDLLARQSRQIGNIDFKVRKSDPVAAEVFRLGIRSVCSVERNSGNQLAIGVSATDINGSARRNGAKPYQDFVVSAVLEVKPVDDVYIALCPADVAARGTLFSFVMGGGPLNILLCLDPFGHLQRRLIIETK